MRNKIKKFIIYGLIVFIIGAGITPSAMAGELGEDDIKQEEDGWDDINGPVVYYSAIGPFLLPAGLYFEVWLSHITCDLVQNSIYPLRCILLRVMPFLLVRLIVPVINEYKNQILPYDIGYGVFFHWVIPFSGSMFIDNIHPQDLFDGGIL